MLIYSAKTEGDPVFFPNRLAALERALEVANTLRPNLRGEENTLSKRNRRRRALRLPLYRQAEQPR